MQEFEPKKRNKILTKEFLSKNAYIFVIAIVMIFGITYGYTFFVQNKKIASGSITTAALTINFTDRSINETGLSVPTDDLEGISEYSKSITITNQTTIDGRVKLTLTRTSGLNLTDMRYALIVNGAIQEIDDVPSDGVILESAIMGNEVINVEVRLWPKSTYSGSETTFVGELTPEIKYLGPVAANTSNLTGKYVNFNCNAGTCEVWQIVKVEDGRLVLTTQANYEGATSRTNSNKYDSTLGLHDDDNLITSVSTDGKNVYLAKTVKINGGSGTLADPYTLVNNDFREPDKKVIAQITYKNGTDTVGTQNVYYNETNYVSQVMDDPGFQGWTDGTNNYSFGDTITFTSDTNLVAIIVQTLQSRIQTLCDDSNVTYVKKYDAQTNGVAIDTLDGSDNEDVCYYTTTSSDRNSDAEQNGNVIFGDYCWQIVRTTADGGVKLVYNGPKTNSGKCTSDADTTNYSSDPRPSSIGVLSSAGTKETSLSGNKKYGTSYEIFVDENDNNTNKFRLKNVTEATWSDSTYKDLIGKYVCGTSSSPTGTDETCTVLYYVGHYQSNSKASTVKYTIGTNAHYSQIGTSAYNASSDSVSMVGYMFNDSYLVNGKFSSSSDIYIFDNVNMYNTNYYYGEKANWNGTAYELLMNDDTPPSNTSAWNDIRGNVKEKYVCTNGSTTCTEVRYIVDNSTDVYAKNILLQYDTVNNRPETIENKQVTWTYGTGITKVGSTYTLTNTGTKTFKLVDWITTYNTDAGFKNIYVCEDFTSTSCTIAYYLNSTSKHFVNGYKLNYTYILASDISYNSNTNSYSFASNATTMEFYDLPGQYNTLDNFHYTCFENYDSVNNTCGEGNPVYYINNASKNKMDYIELKRVNNIGEALVNMLSRDTTENSQMVTVNKYNSAIKGVIDSWYKQNIDDKNLSSYLDGNSVYCNNRKVVSYGGFVPNQSVSSNSTLKFQGGFGVSSSPTLGCDNVTDRFSTQNVKAHLDYSVGLLTIAETNSMGSGYTKTGQQWWLNTPGGFNSNAYGSLVGTTLNLVNNHGIRPAITLKPGVEISSGDGTYNTPYVINTSGN